MGSAFLSSVLCPRTKDRKARQVFVVKVRASSMPVSPLQQWSSRARKELQKQSLTAYLKTSNALILQDKSNSHRRFDPHQEQWLSLSQDAYAWITSSSISYPSRSIFCKPFPSRHYRVLDLLHQFFQASMMRDWVMSGRFWMPEVISTVPVSHVVRNTSFSSRIRVV